MRNSRSIRTAYVGLLLLTVASGAGACELWRDEILGVWRGDCNLTIDPKGPKIVQHFIDGVIGPPRLKMPDLIIRRFSFSLNGNEIEVYANVRNIGTQSSFATNVGVTVDTIGVTDNARQSFTLPVRSVPQLASMAEARIYMDTIFVNNAAQDVDLVTAGMVDQVTVAQPVRGTVIESNETNNGQMHLCRVFGPAPAPVVPGC